jgi:hypothetical protein
VDGRQPGGGVVRGVEVWGNNLAAVEVTPKRLQQGRIWMAHHHPDLRPVSATRVVKSSLLLAKRLRK